MRHFGITTPWFTRADKPVREGTYQARLRPDWAVVPVAYHRGAWSLGTKGLFYQVPINLRHYPAFKWRGLAGPEGNLELIQWLPATIIKPDSDMTVLAWTDEGFCTAYWDDSIPGWIACESGGSLLGVTHWAKPQGPQQAGA